MALGTDGKAWPPVLLDVTLMLLLPLDASCPVGCVVGNPKSKPVWATATNDGLRIVLFPDVTLIGCAGLFDVMPVGI
jgi:hypothetical protein